MGELQMETTVVFDKKEQAKRDKLTAKQLKLKPTKDKRGFIVVKGKDKRAVQLVIPDTFKGKPILEIAEKAFYGQQYLESITIGDGVREIAELAFCGCWFVRELHLGKNVYAIGNAAFKECKGIKTVAIPESVRYIAGNAFTFCYGLEELIFFGKTDMQYGNNIFYGCDKLKKYQGDSRYLRFIPKGTIEKAVITSGEEIIGGAFLDAEQLTSVKIHEGVRTIVESAFEGCSRLTEIVIPEGVERIEKSAFLGCVALEKVILPKTLQEIGSFAFLNCPALAEIEIPQGVRKIGAHIFGENRCPVTNISDVAAWCSIEFEKAQAAARSLKLNGELITELVIPDGVTKINQFAFSNCSAVLSVIVPKSVTGIGDAAFADCSRLGSVNYQGTVKEWLSIVFGNACWEGVPVKEVVCSDGKVLL